MVMDTLVLLHKSLECAKGIVKKCCSGVEGFVQYTTHKLRIHGSDMRGCVLNPSRNKILDDRSISECNFHMKILLDYHVFIFT